jgi:hypothetical protein
MAVSRVVVVVVVWASSVAQELKSIMATAENRDVRMSDFFIISCFLFNDNSLQVAWTDVLQAIIAVKFRFWPAVV